MASTDLRVNAQCCSLVRLARLKKRLATLTHAKTVVPAPFQRLVKLHVNVHLALKVNSAQITLTIVPPTLAALAPALMVSTRLLANVHQALLVQHASPVSQPPLPSPASRCDNCPCLQALADIVHNQSAHPTASSARLMAVLALAAATAVTFKKACVLIPAPLALAGPRSPQTALKDALVDVS